MGFKNTTVFGFDAFTLKSYFNFRRYEARHENFRIEIDEKAVSFLRLLHLSGMWIRTISLDTEAALCELQYLDYKKFYDSNSTYKENFDLLRPDAYDALKTYKYIKI